MNWMEPKKGKGIFDRNVTRGKRGIVWKVF